MENHRRAEAHGRLLRHFTAFAQPAASSSRVAAEFNKSKTNSGAPQPSLGFRQKVLEQLEAARTQITERLRSLAAAYELTMDIHSGPGTSMETNPKREAAGTAENTSSSTPANACAHAFIQHPHPHDGKATAAAASCSFRTSAPVAQKQQQRLSRRMDVSSGKTAERKCPTQRRPSSPASGDRSAAAAAGLLPRPPQSPCSVVSSSLGSRRAPTATTPISTFTCTTSTAATAGCAAGAVSVPVARRPLSYLTTDTDAIHHIAAPVGISVQRQQQRQLQQQQQQQRQVRQTAAADPARKHIDTPLAAAVEYTETMAPEAVHTRPRGAASAVSSCPMGHVVQSRRELIGSKGGGRVAEGPGLSGAMPPSPPMNPMWHGEPVELVPSLSLLDSTAGGCGGAGLHNLESYISLRHSNLVHDAAHLDHRERLQVGLAQLRAEQHASWRALVDSGVV